MSLLQGRQPDRWHQNRFLVLAGSLIFLLPLMTFAQEPAGDAAPTEDAAQPAATNAPGDAPIMPTVWDMAVKGGYFMIPIAICSIIVVAFSIERFAGLRKTKILPPDLLKKLQQLNSEERGLDPREAYKLCQKFRSPIASVIRTAILKAGRPHIEVEKAVEDALAREESALYSNVRPINVCATISPLLGLIGTVQGMIMAFMVMSTTSSTGTAKSQELAQGIYTALVTTFAGLCVAVLAVLLAHHFEGKLEKLLLDMEEIFLELVPHFERFEGKLRIARTVPNDGVEISTKGGKGRKGRGSAASLAGQSGVIVYAPKTKK